jgi:hypothetical protein
MKEWVVKALLGSVHVVKLRLVRWQALYSIMKEHETLAFNGT